jgi:SAM-dependent methyltransferase
MPQADAERWNKRYNNPSYRHFDEPRPFLVQHRHLLSPGGLAVDLACGMGGNAGLLIECGYRVIGVDISLVGLRKARRRLPGLMPVLADLVDFSLPAGRFDLVCCFYYLERSLWPAMKAALKPGGLLIIESLTWEMRSLKPEIDPAFVLSPGELRRMADGMDLLVYREGWIQTEDRQTAVASLVARQPSLIKAI